MQKGFEYKNHLSDIEHVVSRLVVGTDNAKEKPLVSVVMPVYNHPDFFRKSLQSVINQKCDFNYEVVIVDNCHPDFQHRNQQIVEELYCDKIRYYINEENIGGVGSENRGVQLAKGEYITYCHDDDLLYDNALQVLISQYKKIGKIECAIFGNLDTINEVGKIMPKENEFDTILLRHRSGYKVVMNDFLYRNYTNGCGALYKKECLINIGGFCKDYIPCPDYAMNAYYTYKYGAYAIRAKTLQYRVSEQSDTCKVYNNIVAENTIITNNIINIGGVWRKLNKPFVSLHLKVSNYHLYKEWGGENEQKKSYVLIRLINKLRQYMMLISHRFKSFK